MKSVNVFSQYLLFFFVASMLSACGSAPHSQNTVIEEKSSITVSGKQLIGLTVELANGFSHTIVKADIIKDVTKLPSVKRSKDEKFQSVLFLVNTGEVNAKAMRGSALVASKTFFISKGATYQWKIK
jgi:hypothetical protein